MAYSKKNRKGIVRLWTVQKAALYVRVSTRYQIDKDSLPFQRKKLKEYCSFMGIKDSEIFEDDGYSAKNTDRPHFQEMMNRVRNGEFSHVIVWKVDRISRNLLDFASMYAELKDHKVTFISMNEQFDTSSAIGEAMLKIILIFAELERNMTSERVTGIMLDRAENGLWNGARMPVGYRWNDETRFPEPDPEEVKIVQFIFDEYEKTHSAMKVTRYLINNHIKSKRGGTWTSKLVHDIIRNPFYIGTYRYNMRESGRGPLKPESEWVIRKNNHEAIIQKEQFVTCNHIMDENATTRNTADAKKQVHIHTFSGKLFCGKCGASMTACKDKKRLNGYRPSVYRCSERAKTLSCGNDKTISESFMGPFLFNYVANLVNVQNNIKKITCIDVLENELLKGDIFDDVSIKRESLERTFRLLSFQYTGSGTYNPSLAVSEHGDIFSNTDNVHIWESELSKCKTAIERLTDLYLYDPDSMSKEDFSKKRRDLAGKVSELEEKILSSKSKKTDNSMPDIKFIKKASAFLVTQSILSKGSIDYISMVMTLDNEILKDFIDQIVDRIVILDGRPVKIRFANGIEHEFVYAKPNEIAVCDLCGGRIGTTVGCRTRSIEFDGKRYSRVKVGDSADLQYGVSDAVCPDCSAHTGRWHHWKCEKEICPICGELLVKCQHGSCN